MVDRDLLEVLRGEGVARIVRLTPSSPYRFREEAPSAAFCLPDFSIPRNASKLICLYSTRLPQNPAQELGGLGVGVFDRAEERVDSALVRHRVFEDAGDHSPLVLGRDRCVLTGAERHVKDASLDHRGDVKQPLGEVGRSDVGDGEARPVEDPLGQPVVGRRVAFRVLASRTSGTC